MHGRLQDFTRTCGHGHHCSSTAILQLACTQVQQEAHGMLGNPLGNAPVQDISVQIGAYRLPGGRVTALRRELGRALDAARRIRAHPRTPALVLQTVA